MVDARIFPENERLELIRGEVLRTPPFGDRDAPTFVQRHAGCLRRLNHKFNSRLGASAIVDILSPLPLGEKHSEPRLDLALLRFQEDLYSSTPPGPKDILLAIELAGTDLVYGREKKLPLYAEAGIPETWLVDLSLDSLFVYRRSSSQGYRDILWHRRGASVSPEAFPDVRFTVDEILG